MVIYFLILFFLQQKNTRKRVIIRTIMRKRRINRPARTPRMIVIMLEKTKEKLMNYEETSQSFTNDLLIIQWIPVIRTYILLLPRVFLSPTPSVLRLQTKTCNYMEMLKSPQIKKLCYMGNSFCKLQTYSHLHIQVHLYGNRGGGRVGPDGACTPSEVGHMYRSNVSVPHHKQAVPYLCPTSGGVLALPLYGNEQIYQKSSIFYRGCVLH